MARSTPVNAVGSLDVRLHQCVLDFNAFLGDLASSRYSSMGVNLIAAADEFYESVVLPFENIVNTDLRGSILQGVHLPRRFVDEFLFMLFYFFSVCPEFNQDLRCRDTAAVARVILWDYGELEHFRAYRPLWGCPLTQQFMRRVARRIHPTLLQSLARSFVTLCLSGNFEKDDRPPGYMLHFEATLRSCAERGFSLRFI